MKNKKRRKVKNRLSRTYSVQLREQIRKTVDEANANLQPERQIPILVAFQVAGRDLRKTRKLHPDVRVFSAARAVNAHISLSAVGKDTVAALENSDLLPVGHPKSTRVHAMTASALRASRARWIAADPSIVHEESRALVASALSLYPTSVEARHAFARIEAADINRMPLWVRVLAASAAHAMTAALGLGGNSSVARRARAQMQRRDRIGRFAFMGGGFSFGIKIDGVFRAISGKVVGMPEGGEGDLVEIDIRGDKDLADGIYTVNSSRGTSSKAILDVDALPEEARQRAQGTEIDSEAYDIKSLKRMDAPSEFKKKSENNGVISYMTDDAYAVESADGGKSITVRREVGGSLVGKFDDWGKAVSAMGKDQDNYDKYLKTPEGQAELRSGKWDVEVVGDDDVDAPEPSAEPMDLDPSRNITTQITDAVRDKRKVRFNYGGKERVLTPEKISTGEKSGKRNLFGKDGDGNRKSFTLDKIEAPEAPAAPKAQIPDVIDFNPAGKIEDGRKFVADAKANKQKIRFMYNGKERIVSPQEIWINGQTGRINLRAIDSDGTKKNFSLDKITAPEPSAQGGPDVTGEPAAPTQHDMRWIRSDDKKEYEQYNYGPYALRVYNDGRLESLYKAPMENWRKIDTSLEEWQENVNKTWPPKQYPDRERLIDDTVSAYLKESNDTSQYEDRGLGRRDESFTDLLKKTAFTEEEKQKIVEKIPDTSYGDDIELDRNQVRKALGLLKPSTVEIPGATTEDISPEDEKMSDVLREAKPFTDAELQKVIDEINELFEKYDGGALDASDVLDRFGDAIQDVPNNDAIYSDLVKQVENMELRGGTLEKAKSTVEKSVRKNATEEGAVPYLDSDGPGEPPAGAPGESQGEIENKLEKAKEILEGLEDSGFDEAKANEALDLVKSASSDFEKFIESKDRDGEGVAQGELDRFIEDIEEAIVREDADLFPQMDDLILDVSRDLSTFGGDSDGPVDPDEFQSKYNLPYPDSVTDESGNQVSRVTTDVVDEEVSLEEIEADFKKKFPNGSMKVIRPAGTNGWPEVQYDVTPGDEDRLGKWYSGDLGPYDYAGDDDDISLEMQDEEDKLQEFLSEEFDAMFEVPEGAYKVKIFDPYSPRGRTDESSTDYTDDPSVLSQKFTKEELARALAEAVLPGEDGEQASGAGSLEFDAGEETVPAEALYEAIGSTDFDADMILAGLYDSQLDRDRPQTNMERIQQFKDDMTFSPGDDLAEIIPTMTDPDQVILDAEARNRALGRPDRAATALDLVNTYEENSERIKWIAENLVMSQDENLGYNAGNLPRYLQAWLPLAKSSNADDRQGFRSFWGMMMSLDGGSSGPGQLDDSVRNGDGFRGAVYKALNDINDGDTDATDDDYEELIEAFGGMKEFVDGKEAIANGSADLDSENTAAAFYRLVKAASRPNVTPLYRAIGVNSDDPLFETYTTEGSVFGFDARSFTSNEITSTGFGSMMFPAEGDQRRVIFTVAPGEVDSIEALNFSVFAGEGEHFGYGTFEVVSVKEVDTLYGKTRGQKDIVVEVRRADRPNTTQTTGEGTTYSGIESWEKIGGQLGSNEGGTYRDPEGNEYYVKVPRSPSHAQNESLASTFYEELGINATQVSLGFDNGELRIVSPMVQGSTPDFESRLDDQDYINKLKEGFAVDAWLANWDVVGLVYDNVISDSDGNPLRVDPGGSLLWRARGLPKGDAFGDEVVELDTFRDADLNPQSASVFGNMTDEEVRMSAEKLLQITPQRIDELVDSIVTDPTEAATLKTRLKRRRDYILESQGITGPLDAPRPLDVDGNEMDRPELPDDITDEAAMSDYKDRLADFEVGKAVAEVWDCTEGGGLTAAGKKKCTVPTVDELVEKVNADTAEVAPDTKAEAQELVDDVDNFIAERLEEDGLKTTQKSRLESLKKAISDINAKIQSGKISKKAAIDELNDIADGIQIGGDSDFSDTLATIQDIVVDFRKIIDGTINDRPPSKDLPPPGSGKGYAKDGTTFLVPGMRVRTKWGYGGTVDRYDKNSWQVWVTMDIDPAGKFAPGAKKMSFATKTLDAINQGDDNAPWVDLPGVPPGKKPQGGLTYEPTKFAGPGKKVKEEAAKASEADKQQRPKADAPQGAAEAEAPTDKTFKPIDADNRYAAVTRVTQGMANGVPNLESENKLDEHVKDILKVFTSPQQMDILSGTYDSTSGSEEDKRYRFVATDVRVSSKDVGWSSDDTYEVDMLMFSENNGPDSQLQTGPVQQSNAMRTVTVTVLAKPNSSASNTFTLTNDFDNAEDFRAVEYFVSTVAAVSNANKIYVNDSSAQVLAQGGYVYADRSDADFASIGIFNTNLVKILRDLYPPKSEESKTLEKNIVKYTEFTPNGYVTDIDYDMILSKDVMARVKEGVDSGKVRLFEEEGKEGSNPRFVKTIGIPKTPKQIVTDKETRIKSKKELENKSGDENPVEYNKKVDFSTSEIDGLPSMLGAISEVRADTHNELGAPNPVKNRGVSAAIDGTDIEDLEVTVDEVIDEISGDASTRLIFKLTPWAANELKVGKDSDWSINPDEGGYAKLPYTAIDETTGAVIEYPEKVAIRDRLTTFETEVSPGVKIQILLGTRAGSGGVFGSNSKTLASSVRIDIDKNVEVTTELLDEIFRKAGVRSPRPATLDDFRLLSENRAITVLGMGHTSPESNPIGESRKNQLEYVKKKYGFDSSDITVVRSSTGRIEVKVPSEVAKKISADTDTYTLSHSANFYGFLENTFSDFTGFYSTITAEHLKAMANRTVNMLVGRNNEGGELKSSRRRFLRGLPVEGQSTQEDIETGEGGDYVFFTPRTWDDEGNLTDKSADSKHIEFQFDPDKMYERLDFYANSVDNGTGRRERKDSVVDDAAGGGYEVMFKGAVSMDSLRSLVVSPELRPYVIEQLEARGITEINGKDIRDIVLYSGYGPDQDTRDIEKSLSNTQNTSSN
jgi:hypothetical protein